MEPSQTPNSQPPEPQPSFGVPALPSVAEVKEKAVSWLMEQIPLAEALCIAGTVHVLAFPLIWFIGWALPWPKPPVYTTVIEINLENWPEDARPERIMQLYNQELYRKKPK